MGKHYKVDNPDIIPFALYQLGGVGKFIDVEDMFVFCYKLAPERFGWRKHTYPNYKSLSKALRDYEGKYPNHTIDEGYVEDNPVRKVKLYSEKDNLQERILSETEEGKLMELCSETLRPILFVALNTGMRKAEILNLEWAQVDLKERRIRVEKTKNGKIRFVPLNDVLFNELSKLKNMSGQSSFVFFNPETGKPFLDMKTAFKGACKRAEISNLRFHDLRHTFASRLVEKGVDIETLKELLGHHSITITQRYIHSNDERKRAAVDLLSSREEGKICDVSVTQGNQSKLIH